MNNAYNGNIFHKNHAKTIIFSGKNNRRRRKGMYDVNQLSEGNSLIFSFLALSSPFFLCLIVTDEDERVERGCSNNKGC